MYHYFPAGRAIEHVSRKGMDSALLGTGDGTEVLHCHLNAGSKWGLHPEPGWEGLEFIYVLAGTMRCQVEGGELSLSTGDSLSFHPVTSNVIFTAVRSDATFLYISSRPVFHYYSTLLREMRELAVTVEEKDGYTSDHCDRIMRLAMLVGEQMQLSVNQLDRLNLGAFFHDVGKVRVPDEILRKPSSLTADEWKLMKQHPTFGQEMLTGTGHPLISTAADVVAQHHERWDGKGYPAGLRGEEILLEAAIVTVVDSYDAMTSDRPYRKGLSHEESMAEILRGRGTQFRPEVVEAFLKVQDRIREESEDD